MGANASIEGVQKDVQSDYWCHIVKDVFNKNGNIPAPNGDVIHNVSDVGGHGGLCYAQCEIGPCKTKVGCEYEASPNPKLKLRGAYPACYKMSLNQTKCNSTEGCTWKKRPKGWAIWKSAGEPYEKCIPEYQAKCPKWTWESYPNKWIGRSLT